MVEHESVQQDDHDRFQTALVEATRAVGVALTDEQRGLMWEHFRLVVQANRQFNLTRITSAADAAVKHYADSLTLLAAPWIDADGGRPLRVLDVGTGAGFPAVPLAIARPDWRITAIDSTAKKVRFVAEAVGRLGLTNVEARHARAADLARSKQERFDLVLLRAVSRIAAGLDEVHRLVPPGGFSFPLVIEPYGSGAYGAPTGTLTVSWHLLSVSTNAAGTFATHADLLAAVAQLASTQQLAAAVATLAPTNAPTLFNPRVSGSLSILNVMPTNLVGRVFGSNDVLYVEWVNQ